MLKSVLKSFRRPRSVWKFAVLSAILASPSLFCGFSIDDYAHIGVLKGVPLFADIFEPSLDIFNFANGEPVRMHNVIDSGMWPWWTLPELRTAFWRPLTALTHALDYYVWPNWPWLMHLQSLCWLGAAVAMVALCYRRFAATPVVATIAAILFAITDAHMMPAGWLANRNAEIALFWGMLTLWLHGKGRNEKPFLLFITPITLLAALLSNEGGIAACGYIFSFACFLDKAKWKSRFFSLLPYAGVVVAWRIVYSWLGYGAYGSPAYLDPGAEPFRFAFAALGRIPVLLSALYLGPPGELYFLLPSVLRFMLILWCLFVAGIVFALIYPLMRRRQDTKFFALGMLLSLVPASATLPADRLLLFASVGGLGCLAQFFVAAGVFCSPRHVWRKGFHVFAAVCVLILFHFIIAPTRIFVGIPSFHALMDGIEKSAYNTQFDSSVTEKTVVFTNAATIFHTAYFPMLRDMAGLPAPKRIRSLAPNSLGYTRMQVERIDTNTIRVRPRYGYPMVLLRDKKHAFRQGDTVELTGMIATVQKVNRKGLPAVVDFQFDVPLEDPSLVWVKLQGNEYIETSIPSVGETVTWYTAPLISFRI